MFDLARVDVEQADIAPLMTTLIGAAVPKNSVGKLPYDYLDLHPGYKVEAGIAVAKQMYEQLKGLADGFSGAKIHTALSDLDQGRQIRALVTIILAAKYLANT
jgi:hypothetical protein